LRRRARWRIALAGIRPGYQQARGLPADAYPTAELIARIEREASQLVPGLD